MCISFELDMDILLFKLYLKKNVHDKHMHVNLCAPSIQKLFKNMLSTFSFDITLEYKKEER